MSFADLVLVNPPLNWHEKGRMDLKPPLNLLYLASYLNTRGLKVSIIDVVSENIGLNETIAKVFAYCPKAVGVPFYQGTFKTAIEFLQKVKETDSSIFTIGGGPMMTTSSNDLLIQDSLDFGVIGEGELTLEELLKSEFKNLKLIPGLAFKEEGRVIENPARDHLENLDELPFLDFSLVDIEKYLSFQEKLGMPRWLFLSTSRGCTFKCTFCATPVLWPGKMRRVSVERLIKELNHYKELFSNSNFGFMDDSFFSDKKWLNEFFDQITDLNRLYCCIGRADHLELNDVKRLAETGCHYVALGVETGVQERQSKIRKHLNLDKVKRSVKALAENGILTKCFFMLGFPDETIEEMRKTINFAVECAKLGMHEAGFFPVSAYPGTELAKNLNHEMCISTVYNDVDGANKALDEFESAEERAEKRLSIYANIPDVSLNKFLNRDQLIELIKLAYIKVERHEELSLDEMKGF